MISGREEALRKDSKIKVECLVNMLHPNGPSLASSLGYSNMLKRTPLWGGARRGAGECWRQYRRADWGKGDPGERRGIWDHLGQSHASASGTVLANHTPLLLPVPSKLQRLANWSA